MSVPLERVLLLRRPRALFPAVHSYTILIISTEKLKLEEETTQEWTRKSFKTQTMSTDSSLEQLTKRMMRRRTRSMNGWTRTWTPAESRNVREYIRYHFVPCIHRPFYREVREEAKLSKHSAERPKLQQQLDLKRGLAAVTDEGTTSGTATSVDPKGYLTSLDSVAIKSKTRICDIKRVRMLSDSPVRLNPKHAPGWITAACLEEHVGRMVAARKLIEAGCEHCPKSECV